MKRKGSYLSKKRNRTGLLFLVPITIFEVLFILVPLVNIFRYSFLDMSGYVPSAEFIGLANFQALPETEGFWEMVKATLIYSVGVTAIVVVGGYLLALALDAHIGKRINRSLMRVFWFFPCLLSGVIVGVIWRIMYNYNGGLVNFIISNLGLEKVNWLETYGVTMGAVIVATVWSMLGLTTIIFLAGLQNIPNDLLEAAELDGASYWQKQLKVVLPLMAPSITINVLNTNIAAFKAYELPFTVSKGLPGYSTRLLTQRIFFYSFTTNEYGIAAALSVMLILVITILSLIQLTILRKREEYD